GAAELHAPPGHALRGPHVEHLERLTVVEPAGQLVGGEQRWGGERFGHGPVVSQSVLQNATAPDCFGSRRPSAWTAARLPERQRYSPHDAGGVDRTRDRRLVMRFPHGV